MYLGSHLEEVMNYVETVAALFLERSGKMFISPTEYAKIAEWEKEAIPLEIILAAIDRGFDAPTMKNEIDSIDHFHDEIKKGFAAWLHNGNAK